MSLIKVDAIESTVPEKSLEINSDVKFIGVLCATTIYVGDTTVINSGGTSSNQGYIWLLSEPISPGNKPSPTDNYFNIELFSGLTNNPLNPNNLLKIKVNNGDTSSTSRDVWWAALQQTPKNGLLQITYAGNASNSATIQISEMFGIGNGWQINGKVIAGPPSGQTLPVYERHYLNWSFGPSSGGTSTFTGNSFNQSSDFAVYTDRAVNITGSGSVNYFQFFYIDYTDNNQSLTSNVFSSTTSTITVNGDYSSLIFELPIQTTSFYIGDGPDSFNLNKYYYDLPTITDITYDIDADKTTFVFSPSLEATYYFTEGFGSSTVGAYSTAEGVSVNALSDYSHAEGGYTQTGLRAFYSSSIIDGVITIENIGLNQQNEFLIIEKDNRNYIIFDDSQYQDNYGYDYFSISSTTYIPSAQTYTIYLQNTGINTSEALIACVSLESTHIIPYKSYQHSEGYFTIAGGESSHSEGNYTISLGEGSHVEGIGTMALGGFSHAEGDSTFSDGFATHSEGGNTKAYNYASHSEGYYSEAHGYASHAEGYDTFALGEGSHAEGSATFTPTYYTYITAVDENTETITVTNTANFNVGNLVAYVRSAGGNYNQLARTYIKSIDYTAKTMTLQYAPNISNNVFCGLNGGLSDIGVLFRLDTSNYYYSHSEGSFTVAIGTSSHSEGRKTAALGNHSHAEGVITQAAGTASHAEGSETQANHDNSHAEGENTKAGINAIPANVVDATTLRLDSGFGDLTNSISFYNLNPGDLKYYYKTQTTIEYNNLGSTTLGFDGTYTYITAGSAFSSYLIGQDIYIYNPRFSRIENEQTWPDGNNYERFGFASHAEGSETQTFGSNSHAEGYRTTTFGSNSHAEGDSTGAIGTGSHSEGYNTQAIGDYSHSEGSTGMGGAIAAGMASHTEGIMNLAGARGYRSTNVVNGIAVLNENETQDLTDVFVASSPIIFDDRQDSNTYGGVIATISASTFEAGYTTVVFDNLTLNGSCYIYLPYNINPRGATYSIGDASHAEGIATQALGTGSHTEGSGTLALGNYSHAEGYGTITTKDYQHASGKFNKSANTESLMVVGNGTYENRSDIFYINENSVNVESRFDNGYRTYRALLTHIPPQDITSNQLNGLIVGETYKILNYVAGDDFLNVGATTNSNTDFVATGRYPTNWSNGSQLTVETPTLVVNVLENSFDDEIVWVLNPFGGEGAYGAYFSNGNQTFPREKTSIVTSQLTPYDFYPFVSLSLFSAIYSESKIDDFVYLSASAYDGVNNYNYDGLLFNTTIEIKSYVGFKPTVYLDDYTVNGNGTVDFYVTLASSGSSKVTEFGIVWSLTPNPTIADNKLNFGNIFGNIIGSDMYNVDFNNELGNYIYARAYAINRAGVTYHEVNQITFIPND
jgi:hypothetical protein